MPMPAHWTLFCAMVDNFGDIGVCWRLARQLKREHGIDVDLWVDDWAAAERFLTAQRAGLQWPDDAEEVSLCGVKVLRWRSPWPDSEVINQRIAESGMVIEAFACELPETVKQAMAQTQRPLLWINLEYLSAERWVTECHGLPSPHSYGSGVGPSLLRKFFFFPGFEPRTGGLLREAGLLERHAGWQFSQAQNTEYSLVVSLFSYETPALGSWLTALSEGPERVLCWLPQGRSQGAVADFFGNGTELVQLQAGTAHTRGALTVAVVPFMSQEHYDQLLSLCDFNVVRGEDSFVRAQWAAKPFMWHIYPQADGVHIKKLEAFADCYLQGLDFTTSEAWRRFATGWNLGEDCRELWHHLRAQLPAMRLHNQEWQKKLAVMPDLATSLVNFKTFTKLSVRP